MTPSQSLTNPAQPREENMLGLLRLLLAALVATTHARLLGGIESEPLARRTNDLSLGTIAVAAFFALSGSLVAASYMRLGSRIPDSKGALLANLPGCENVYFSRLTPPQAINLLRTIQLRIGWHGTALANKVFLPPGAHVVEFADTLVPAVYARLAQAGGIGHRVINAQQRTPPGLAALVRGLHPNILS